MGFGQHSSENFPQLFSLILFNLVPDQGLVWEQNRFGLVDDRNFYLEYSVDLALRYLYLQAEIFKYSLLYNGYVYSS